MPGSSNDILVLGASPVFANIVNGCAPKCEYTINGNTYHQGYYLADGIYPDYSTLVKTISRPQGLERKVRINDLHVPFLILLADSMSQHFALMQEAAQKDVERSFGVL
jgi:hypothetical protein